uniref:Anaphase-promoting complex subunit 5 n=1 Tax=Bursaphelenchus xylophilus TaxID=6326 RepID=A0A1I7S7I1_BURXY
MVVVFRFTIECEDCLNQRNIQSKVIDLVWEVGWYYPIDIFCKANKRPDSSVLKPFLDSGMVYFETLKPSYPDVAYKISIFLGDLHRYAFKLCKSESIDSSIRYYLASLNENSSNSAVYLKLSIVYKEKDPELCILYYLRYCLLRRPTDLAAKFPLKTDDVNTTFSALAFCMIRNVGYVNIVLPYLPIKG